MITHDTSETPGYNSKAPKMPRLECSMFSRAPLTVVPISNHNPLYALLLVISRSRWDSIYFTGKIVLHPVSLPICCVDRADEHVVGNVVEMATILEPWARH